MRLLIRVLGEVAEHERRSCPSRRASRSCRSRSPGCRARRCRSRRRRPAPLDVAVVGERQRAATVGRAPNAAVPLPPSSVIVQRSSRRPRAGGELERQPEIGLAGQRLRADLLQLGDDVVAGEPLAVRSGQPALEARRGERLDVRARLRRAPAADARDAATAETAEIAETSSSATLARALRLWSWSSIMISCSAFSAARS